MSETSDPHPTDAPEPVDASTSDDATTSPEASAPAETSASADGRPGSRGGRIVAAILVSALVGAATFVLMAVGESF